MHEVNILSWYEEDNPNNVTIEHFKRAIALAGKCKPERSNKIAPKVGVVVVKNVTKKSDRCIRYVRNLDFLTVSIYSPSVKEDTKLS